MAKKCTWKGIGGQRCDYGRTDGFEFCATHIEEAIFLSKQAHAAASKRPDKSVLKAGAEWLAKKLVEAALAYGISQAMEPEASYDDQPVRGAKKAGKKKAAKKRAA